MIQNKNNIIRIYTVSLQYICPCNNSTIPVQWHDIQVFRVFSCFCFSVEWLVLACMQLTLKSVCHVLVQYRFCGINCICLLTELQLSKSLQIKKERCLARNVVWSRGKCEEEGLAERSCCGLTSAPVLHPLQY